MGAGGPPDAVTGRAIVATLAPRAASKRRSVPERAFVTSASRPSGVKATRIGKSAERRVSTGVSVSASSTVTVFAARLVTHSRAPSGDSAIPSAPAPVAVVRCR